MIKTKLPGAALLTIFFLTIAVCAQRKTQIDTQNFSNQTLRIKREFVLKAQAENNESKNEANPFAREKSAEKTPAENNSVRRQTYVRPSKEARFKRYASDAFGVPALIGATFGATINQIDNNPPEWRKTVGGFSKRFASSYGTNVVRNTVSYGLSEAFKLDNRFERSGQKNFGKRLKHVFVSSYTTRKRNGRRVPDFPYVTGTYTASIIANEAWYPKRYSYKDGLRDGTISLGVRFGINLLREFIFPK